MELQKKLEELTIERERAVVAVHELTGAIKLIEQQKLMQLGQKGIESSYKSLVNIIIKLYKKKD